MTFDPRHSFIPSYFIPSFRSRRRRSRDDRSSRRVSFDSRVASRLAVVVARHMAPRASARPRLARVARGVVIASLCAVARAANLTQIASPFADVDARTVEFITPAAHASSAPSALSTIAYVLGARTISALTLTTSPVTLTTIATLDEDATPCEGLFAYESARDGVAAGNRARLAVTCAGTNSLLIYGVDGDGTRATKARQIHAVKNATRIAEPTDVVVVNGTLAFVASRAHARVVFVKLDPNENDAPTITGSTYQLSGIDKIQLGPYDRQTLRTMSGMTRRVTTLKYTSAGTMQLVGSVKDSRLESASGACVGMGGGERAYTYVVTPTLNGGTFSIFNSSTYGAPEYLNGVHAGRLAPNEPSDGFELAPAANRDLSGARDVSVHGTTAYVAAKSIGAIVVVDITDPNVPVVLEKARSSALAGVDRVVASPDGVFVVAAVNATDDGANATIVIASKDDTAIAKHGAYTGAKKRRRLFSSSK